MSGNMQMPMPQQMPQGFPRPNGQAARWETRPQNSIPLPAAQYPMPGQPGILDRIAQQTPAMTHPAIARMPQIYSVLGYQDPWQMYAPDGDGGDGGGDV